jgi:peptidoglycan/xylan/chitin deacetylase (PgdA/CDA1 family)
MLNIPVLMYHSVNTRSDDYLTVSQERFATQIAHLVTDYSVIQVNDVIQHQSRGVALPEKPIIISFDDAMMDNIEFALPVLEQYGATAIFFAIAGYLGKDNDWNHRAYRFANHMGSKDLRDLVTNGYEVGNHSLTHHRLTKLSDEQLHNEFFLSHQIITEATGREPYAFSYPYGDADEDCYRICAEFYGFGFVSTEQGNTDWMANPTNIKRIYIGPEDSPQRLNEKIEAYGATDHFLGRPIQVQR